MSDSTFTSGAEKGTNGSTMGMSDDDSTFTGSDRAKAACRPESPGPVEILCREIRYPFTQELEQPSVLIAFVRVLVGEISDMVTWRSVISRGFSEEGFGTLEATRPLDAVKALLEQFPMPPGNREQMCAELHNGLLYTPDAGPCNHLIEMLSSCVSAIRFGLEMPCHSRHAAAASDHIWKHKYGVRLFDGCTSDWQKDWARRKLTEALQVSTPALDKAQAVKSVNTVVSHGVDEPG
jgi:hypothetical protein